MPPNNAPLFVWIGPIEDELGWTWKNVQQHSAAIHIPSMNDFEHRWPVLNPTHIFLASDSRQHQLENEFCEIQRGLPNVPCTIVLGPWWTGHRRCRPLPESIVTAYWYQWWDVIQPSLRLGKLQKTVASTRVARIVDDTSVKSTVQTVPRLVMVVSQGSSRRDHWRDILSGLGMQPVFTDSQQPWPEADFHSILLDLPSMEDPSLSNGGPADVESPGLVELDIAQCKQRYPQARLILLSAWPRLEDWLRYEQAGVDRLLSSPSLFHFLGDFE